MPLFLPLPADRSRHRGESLGEEAAAVPGSWARACPEPELRRGTHPCFRPPRALPGPRRATCLLGHLSL